MMKVEDVQNRIDNLAMERGLSRYELAHKAGIPQSTLYNMFERHTLPKLDTLELICDALEVSLSDFFLFTTKPGEGQHISEDEILLLELNRELTRRDREHLIIYAKGMIASSQTRNGDPALKKK